MAERPSWEVEAERDLPSAQELYRAGEREPPAGPDWFRPYATPAEKVAADTMRNQMGIPWTPTSEVLRGMYLPPPATPPAAGIPPPMEVNLGVLGHGPQIPGITVPAEVLERQKAADEARAREVETTRGIAQAQEADVKGLVAPTRPTPPKAPVLPKAPDVGLRPFMTPAEHAQTGEVLRNFVGLLGATVGSFGGASRHAAAGSLAALTGAMKGWSEGDRDRVNREIERWRTETERLLKQYELEIDEYNSVLADGRLTWDQQITVMNARAAVRENYRLVDSLNVKDKMAGLKEIEDRWIAVENLKIARGNADRMLQQMGAPSQPVADKVFSLTGKHWWELPTEARRQAQADAETAIQRQRVEGREAEGRAAAQVMKEARAGEAESGIWKDLKHQRIVTPAKGEIERANTEEPGRYVRTNETQEALIERIESGAIPNVRALYPLVTHLLTTQPVENIINAGILALEGKTSANPALREFENAVGAVNVELSTILGGNAPRVAILRMLQQDISISTRENRAPALNALNQMYIDMENRRRAFFHQPPLPLKTLMPGHWVVSHNWGRGPVEEIKIRESEAPLPLEPSDVIVDWKGWK